MKLEFMNFPFRFLFSLFCSLFHSFFGIHHRSPLHISLIESTSPPPTQLHVEDVKNGSLHYYFTFIMLIIFHHMREMLNSCFNLSSERWLCARCVIRGGQVYWERSVTSRMFQQQCEQSKNKFENFCWCARKLFKKMRINNFLITHETWSYTFT